VPQLAHGAKIGIHKLPWVHGKQFFPRVSAEALRIAIYVDKAFALQNPDGTRSSLGNDAKLRFAFAQRGFHSVTLVNFLLEADVVDGQSEAAPFDDFQV